LLNHANIIMNIIMEAFVCCFPCTRLWNRHYNRVSGLSEFQKHKLRHDFETFWDLNKTKLLEGSDFELAKKQISALNNWKDTDPRYRRMDRLFQDLWHQLVFNADIDGDNKISSYEWLKMWEKNLDREEIKENSDTFMKEMKKRLNAISIQPKDTAGGEADAADKMSKGLPMWMTDYILYKFELFDRNNDGVITMDEYVHVLKDFRIPQEQSRKAFLKFSEEDSRKVDYEYFCELTIEFYTSNCRLSKGNFITGQIDF